jgi:hypothetical protein
VTIGHLRAQLRAGHLRAGLLALAAGGAIAIAAQLATPVGRPLYDGVGVIEPYRYLSPGPGEAGAPSPFAGDQPVTSGTSSQITAATPENPPQAQLIALAGAFTVAASTTTLHVTIDPVAPPSVLPPGPIAGNVYRVGVTDPSGATVGTSSAHRPTLAMRTPSDVANGAIARFSNGQWQVLQTEHAPALAIYTAEVDAFGDFAVVDLGATAVSPTGIVLASLGALLVVALGLFAARTWRRRHPAPEPQPAPRRRAASKRRRPPGSR